MKKKIAIMLTLILAAGTFTACTAEEKVNNSSLSPTVSTSVGVSVSTETSATVSTEKTTETTTPEKAAVSKETEPLEQNIKTEEKSYATAYQNKNTITLNNYNFFDLLLTKTD